MELLQLRYFFESAQNESFSKTAEKYMVPISSVSASVKRLENELQCKLFDRTSNRIVLNENGKKLKDTLGSVFLELDRVVEELSLPRFDSREIKILVRAVRRDITDAIIEYGKKHPHVAFKIHFDFDKAGLDTYDIIIDEKKDEYPAFERFELFNMKIIMKVAASNPLSKKRLVLKQLSKENFVSLGEDSNMHKMLISAARRVGFTPNVVAQINDLECYEKMIACGRGIGLGKQLNPPEAGISYLNVVDFDERYIVYAHYKESAFYGNVEHFLKFLKKQSPKD